MFVVSSYLAVDVVAAPYLASSVVAGLDSEVLADLPHFRSCSRAVLAPSQTASTACCLARASSKVAATAAIAKRK